MELSRVLSLLRRWWWMLALGALIGGGSAYGASQLMTPIYRASTTLLVNQTQTPGVIAYNDILTSERLTKTYSELITKRPVLDATISDLGVSLSTDELASFIDVEVVQDTQLLRLSVEHPVPVQAQLLADSVAATFIEFNDEDELSRTGTVSIVESADLPASPVRPRTSLNTLMGALVGLVVAGAIVVLYEYLDNTVKTPEDVDAAAGMPTLGGVSRFPKAQHRVQSLVVAAGDHTAAAEAYRVLRTNLQFSTLQAHTLLVTSASPREGKTTTTANLAAAIAQTGQRVVVVDSDLRRPGLHEVFGLGNGGGLTNALMSEEPAPQRLLQPTDCENLSLLASGPTPPNPSEMLSSRRMDAALAALREEADVILLDSPPLLAVADASILGAKVDGAILVVDAGRTRGPALQRAATALTQTGTKIMGVILNKVAESRHSYYGYGYYYTSSKDSTNGHRKRRLPWSRAPKPAQRSKAGV